MYKSSLKIKSIIMILGCIFLTAFLGAGCGENEGGSSITNLNNGVNDEATVDFSKIALKDMILTDENEDEYFDKLEKLLNEQFSENVSSPRKPMVSAYLSSISLNKRTDEAQICSAYDLSAIEVTATFSNGTTEVVTPVWSIYSGVKSLDGRVYTIPSTPGRTVFIACYSFDGMNRFAIFRLYALGTSKLLLSKTTDEIQAAGIYDLSKINIKAVASNGKEKDVTGDPNTVWVLSSGRGILTDKTYAAPPAAESSIFTVSYTESNVVQSAQFVIKIVGQTALILSKVSDKTNFINGVATYDLSNISVSSKYSNGIIRDVTNDPNTLWAVSTGSGTLTEKVYSTSIAEATVMTVSYTEGGITKSANFTLKLISPSSITLSQSSAEINLASGSFDLSNILITVKYSDGSYKDVTNDPGAVWSIYSGKGSLNGKVYSATAPESAILRVSYTEGGVCKSANFTLKIIGLSGVLLSKTTDEISLLPVGPTTYDLSAITVSSKYSNGTIVDVTNASATVWTKTSGKGTLSGKIYEAPALAETAVFTVSYTESGIIKTSQFRLYIRALSSITLSPVTDSVSVNKQYDLSVINVTANYSGGVKKDVTQDANTTWIKSSGRGVLTGKIYAATSVGETAIFTAKYIESGITKTAQFKLSVLVDSIAPTVVLSDDHADAIVKNGDIVNITAAFTENDMINETTPPSISIGSLIANANMTKVDNLHWTYNWNVAAPAETFGTFEVVIKATDKTGNLCNSVSGKIMYTLDNIAPTYTLSNDIIDGHVIQVGDVVTINATFTESDQIDEAIPPTLNIDVIDGSTETVISSMISHVPMIKTDNLHWKYVWNVQTFTEDMNAAVNAPLRAASVANILYKVTVNAFDIAGNQAIQGAGANFYTTSALTLSKETDEIALGTNLPTVYDLSAINVIFTQLDGTQKDVTNDPNTIWSVMDDEGTITGKTYSTTCTGVKKMQVAYTESGITYTKDFSLKIYGLSSITLSVNTVEVQMAYRGADYLGYYDQIESIEITAHYTNGTSINITNRPNTGWAGWCMRWWQNATGNGLLYSENGKLVYATRVPEDAVIRACYVECGITKTVDLNLNIIGVPLTPLKFSFAGIWNLPPTSGPTGISYDKSSGCVYVTETESHLVKKFGTGGNLVMQWGGIGTENGKFRAPYGVATDDSGNVYVADYDNNRIQKFDAGGSWIWTIGGFGTGDGQFNHPIHLAVYSNTLYVLDRFNSRIQKFDLSGNFISKWGTYGTGDGQINNANGIAVDSFENIYVADTYNHCIQKFDSNGTFLAKYTGGDVNNRFNLPCGVAVDSAGYIFVADSFNHQIKVIDPIGRLNTKWGELGVSAGQFSDPHGITLDSSGAVYVTDYNNKRIQKFTLVQ